MTPAPERRHTIWRAENLWWVYLVTVAIVCGMYLAVAPLKGSGPVVDGLGLSGVVAILFGIEMHRLMRQREKSVAREKALTAAGGLLVSASSREQMGIAALRAATAVANEAVAIRMCRISAEGMVVERLKSSDAVNQWPAPSHLADELEPGEVKLSAEVRLALQLPDGFSRGLVFDLDKPDRDPRVLLVVAAAGTPAADSRQALATLSNQVALAFETVGLSEEVHRRASEARFSSLVQNASDLITVLDAEMRIVYQSPSVTQVLGFRAEELIGESFERLLHPSENVRLLRRLRDGGAAKRSRPEPIECLLAHQDGSVRHFEILHTDLLQDSAVRGIVLNGRDVSERKAFEHELSHQAFHDPVTHLANRALFNERVRHAVARGRREERSLAVLFLDLDDFKTVNDSLGHAAGDHLLLEVAQRIAAATRASDTAARFGGDEFAVLLEDIDDPQAAAETAERILDSLKRPIALDAKDFVVRASLGISVAEAGAPADAEELIRNADAAMYIAKADGKGGYRLFEPAMHERVLERLELRGDLERALEREEFEIFYQPVVRLQDGVVRGVEALLRWHHPERGLVPPGDFIPFAEETGLIVPIGRWVLREGCRQAKELRDRFRGATPPTMSINLSVKQLFHSDIVSDVIAALHDSGLEASALTLEITESVMMTDIEMAVRRLHELRSLGVRLAMDDFGTGYSSLSYLSRFPLDILKMDRSLLAAGASPVTSGLASAVLGLGETFALEVVAEGIEYPEQSSTLRDLGCELGQGFYFARPMNAGSLLEFFGAAISPAVEDALAPISGD